MQMFKGGKNSGVYDDCGVGGKNRGANRKVSAGDFNRVKGDKENRLNLIEISLRTDIFCPFFFCTNFGISHNIY